MKLASLNKGRDGQLIIVSRDLKQAVDASDIAPTMQAAIDDWGNIEPLLQERYANLIEGKLDNVFEFNQSAVHSPLPRAYQWADGSAYVNHVELVRKARGAEMPPSFWEDPLIYQGGSDNFLQPHGDIPVPSDEFGIDFEAEIAIITDDVEMGVSKEKASDHIKLFMLVNDVSLRGLIPAELAKGFGFFQSKPASSFSPVAVTPDELGDAWQNSMIQLPLISTYNGTPFGKPNAGEDMTFSFSRLIAHVCKTRRMCAGSIIGSGTVSNKQGTDHGTSISEGGVGYSCIAEVRMIETIRDGKPSTPFMTFGDTIRIEMLNQHGQSIFGAIEQKVVKA